jgi:serine/threonine-protein phosphatase 2B catalytic subunit
MENENIVKLKGLCPDKRIPKGLLCGDGQGLKDGTYPMLTIAIGKFQNAKQADSINEKRPLLIQKAAAKV